MNNEMKELWLERYGCCGDSDAAWRTVLSVSFHHCATWRHSSDLSSLLCSCTSSRQSIDRYRLNWHHQSMLVWLTSVHQYRAVDTFCTYWSRRRAALGVLYTQCEAITRSRCLDRYTHCEMSTDLLTACELTLVKQMSTHSENSFFCKLN